MFDEHEPPGTTRRTVLGTLAAVAGTAGVASAAQQEFDVDADNLVAGNPRFTVTLDGLPASELGEVTVSVGGIAIASVDVIDGASAILALDARNLAEHDAIQNSDAVTVEVWAQAGGQEYAGTDESLVILND